MEKIAHTKKPSKLDETERERLRLLRTTLVDFVLVGMGEDPAARVCAELIAEIERGQWGLS